MIESIFSLESIIIAVAVSGILVVIGRTLDNFNKKFWTNNKIIKKIQPLLPLIIAPLCALIYSPEIADTIPKALLWGIIPGLMASSGFKILKTLFMEKFNIELDEPNKKEDKK